MKPTAAPVTGSRRWILMVLLGIDAAAFGALGLFGAADAVVEVTQGRLEIYAPLLAIYCGGLSVIAIVGIVAVGRRSPRSRKLAYAVGGLTSLSCPFIVIGLPILLVAAGGRTRRAT